MRLFKILVINLRFKKPIKKENTDFYSLNTFFLFYNNRKKIDEWIWFKVIKYLLKYFDAESFDTCEKSL